MIYQTKNFLRMRYNACIKYMSKSPETNIGTDISGLHK